MGEHLEILVLSFAQLGAVFSMLWYLSKSAAEDRRMREESLRSCMAYLGSRNAQEAETAIALKNHEEEALKQAIEAAAYPDPPEPANKNIVVGPDGSQYEIMWVQ